MSAVNNPVADSSRPIRILVLQFTRLGDTLQSLMALRAAKQLYPALEITFVARERFASAAKRVPWIHEVITFPTDVILGPVLSGIKTETQGLGELARWLAPLVKEPWDLVVNWSYSESSSYLTGLLPARIKLGYSRRKDMSFASTDGWSHYIQAIVQGGVHQNIHLTDVLTTQLLTALQIHYGDPVNDGNAPVTSKSFFSLELGDHDLSWSDVSRKWIAIQLGAGSEAKTWEPERWARLAKMILRRNPEFSIVLLGGSEDHSRAKRFFAELGAGSREARGVVSLVGETDFDLWASVVGRCNWLFAGDTAALHLASVLGTRVLNVSLGPVRWAETGPYGNGHYVVSTQKPCAGCSSRSPKEADHSCRADLTPEAVYGVWSYASSEWAHRRQLTLENHFAQLGWGSMAQELRVFRSKIRSSNDGGGVLYEPMVRRPLPLSDWSAMVMGHIARAWYCGWVPPVGQELTREMIGPDLVQKLRQLEESSQVLSKICTEAVSTASALNRRGGRLRSDKVMGIRERDELRDLGKKLMELDALVERVGNTQPALLAFAQMSKVQMHNLRSTQLADLGRESADCYRQLGEGLTILVEWVKHTLGLARPVAIKAEGLASVSALGKPNKEISPT